MWFPIRQIDEKEAEEEEEDDDDEELLNPEQQSTQRGTYWFYIESNIHAYLKQSTITSWIVRKSRVEWWKIKIPRINSNSLKNQV